MDLLNGQATIHAVVVQGLRIRYDEIEVVRGVSLSVMPGEIVSLLGPSGCGKTTTLRAIAGFVVPEFGDVYLNGQNVTNVAPHRRNIGMVFQGYALFPHLSVFDNVAYGLRMRKTPRREIAERVEGALALVRLTDFAGRRPKHLSGGQQQRVAIARALVTEPKVLLLDEPLSNLDAKLRQGMRVELRRLLKSTRAASIFVTHDQEEAMVISDRIVLMNNGEIVQEGSPREIYQEPSSLFAAAFIGQANFLQGVVTDVLDAGRAVVNVDGTSLSGVACGVLERGMPATLVVKHERVHLVTSDASKPANMVDCTFEMNNFIGANIQLHCSFNGRPIVGLIPASIRATAPVRAGSPMQLNWDEADALIFPDSAPGD